MSIEPKATDLERAVKEDDASDLTPEEILSIVIRTKAEGRCGSLQTSSGMPCRRWCKIGYTVCRKHGERAPATRAKAERALVAARMPAIAVLNDQLEQWGERPCSACGYPSHDVENRRVYNQVAKMVLDRTGFGPSATLNLTAGVNDDTDKLLEAMTAAERGEVAMLVGRIEAIKNAVRGRAGRPVLAPAVIDAAYSVEEHSHVTEGPEGAAVEPQS